MRQSLAYSLLGMLCLSAVYGCAGNGVTSSARAEKITYTSLNSGIPEIFSMWSDGTGQQRLTNNGETDFFSTFDSSGRWIYYCHYSTISSDIYVMRSNGTDKMALMQETFVEELQPILRPSDNSLAYVEFRDNPEVMLFRPNGGSINLSNHEASDSDPYFDPNDNRIAFTSFRTGFGQIFVIDLDGTNLSNLSNSSWFDGQPAFSPDGTKIAFTSLRNGDSEIYIMDEDGTNQIRLTNSLGNDSRPCFSLDGQRLYFESDRNGLSQIFSMRIDGSEVRQLSFDPSGATSPRVGR